MSTLKIIHFNDVYRVQPFKLEPTSNDKIDVTQFAHMLDSIRKQWPDRQDGKKDGLVLFSGDLFSPSVESSVTRGSHMVRADRSCPVQCKLVHHCSGSCDQRTCTGCFADWYGEQCLRRDIITYTMPKETTTSTLVFSSHAHGM
jgi:hypothetical protein